jgi:hypothetical protein
MVSDGFGFSVIQPIAVVLQWLRSETKMMVSVWFRMVSVARNRDGFGMVSVDVSKP